jgi:WXG100 family type VII secretion target
MAGPGGGTSAQTQLMAKAAVDVDNAGQVLAGIRGRIQQAVAATSTGYVSDAGHLFRSVMDQWDTDFQTIVNGLQRIHEALTQTHHNYTAGIQQDRQSANQIAALLNGGADKVI